MSSERSTKRARPGFGKRGGAKTGSAEHMSRSLGDWGRICRRWLGGKPLQRTAVRKGFGFKQPRQTIR
jgi:hypothetical protein